MTDEEIIKVGKSTCSLFPWGIGSTRNDFLKATRAVLSVAYDEQMRRVEDRFIAEHGHRLAQLMNIDAFDIADRDAQIMSMLKGNK